MVSDIYVRIATSPAVFIAAEGVRSVMEIFSLR